MRKKSAKVLEMEEFDVLEKTAHKKTPKSSKKAGKPAKTSLSPLAEFPGIGAGGDVPVPPQAVMQNLIPSPLSGPVSPQSPLPPLSSPPAGSVPGGMPGNQGPPVVESIKMKLNFNAALAASAQNPLVAPPGQLPPPPPSKSEKKAKESKGKSKKGKAATDTVTTPLQISTAPEPTAILQGDTGLKMKLMLSPKKDTPVVTPQSALLEQLSAGLQMQSPPIGPPPPSTAEKKVIHFSSTGSDVYGLLNFLNYT